MIHLGTMTSVCPDKTLDETVDAMKRYGYAALEPRVEWGHKQGIELDLSAAQRDELKKRFAEEGLSLSCIATSVRMANPDAAERQSTIDSLHAYIDLAGDIGAPCIRTFGGARNEKVTLRAVCEYTAAGYRQVAAHAAERGVTVLMETHDAWCRSAEVRAVVEATNHENVKVLWDLMHPARFLEQTEITFANLGALTRHLHAHDGKYAAGGERLEGCPLGEGDIDHAGPLERLSEAGFDGCFSVEVIHKPGSEHDADGVLEQYAGAFRRIMAAIA